MKRERHFYLANRKRVPLKKARHHTAAQSENGETEANYERSAQKALAALHADDPTTEIMRPSSRLHCAVKGLTGVRVV